ncbi:hypothetical protein JK628_15735 [Shewanella sp. KX20019]|uniref:hypothetical protein n=1 Tax=Shewanella sp. KX20019 TaxID=2803864 RepID=UPI001928DD1E|nr:hypothetical protein [Shewanella sp. KX20019]QQX79005.1 hypothetical protein JK628_15735 [Shewanella sp. KX20019]
MKTILRKENDPFYQLVDEGKLSPNLYSKIAVMDEAMDAIGVDRIVISNYSRCSLSVAVGDDKDQYWYLFQPREHWKDMIIDDHSMANKGETYAIELANHWYFSREVIP